MSLSDALPDAPKPPIAHPVRIFLVANFIYLWLVHAWGLWVPPPDLNFNFLDAFGNVNPFLHGFMALAMENFGSSIVGYHIVNILLLYGCMVGVFFLTKSVVKGPWWLGSLAAVLMMANPLKTEATVAFTGMLQLIPALCVITGILLVIRFSDKENPFIECSTAMLIAAAMLQNPAYLFAPFVVGGLQVLCAGFKPLSFLFWCLFQFGALYWNYNHLQFAPTDALLSLFMIVYPIGLLPGTAAALNASPWLATAAAALIFVAWIALWRATRHPAVLACGLAAILLRINMPPIDLVTMQGGETMLLPIALVAIGFAAVCHSILQHPAWPRHVVFLTTVLCLIFFGLQIRAIRAHSAPDAPAPAVTELHP